MTWTVLFHTEFAREFEMLSDHVQNELLARLKLLEHFGPALGRPNLDTLEGSKFANMKELRFRLDGLWPFAFAFDPDRNAVVLVGGNKVGAKSGPLLRRPHQAADRRFAAHIDSLKRKQEKE